VKSKVKSQKSKVKSPSTERHTHGVMVCPSPFILLLRFFFRRSLSVSRLPLFVFFSVSISVAVFFLGGCGRKTVVLPPELVAPQPINDLTLEVQEKSVTLHWGRAQKTVGGEDLDDLGGFVVLRAVQDPQGNENEFSEIATIPVEDRDRFRQNKKFSYTDEQLTAGALYRYRVQAFTLDGYRSRASNTVELVWKKD
jgi:hypothetical protein